MKRFNSLNSFVPAFLVTLSIFVFSNVNAANQVSTANGHVVRMEYASDLGATVEATVDFQVTSINLGFGNTGWLNVAVDLNRDEIIDPVNEWVVQNIPMFLDDGLVNQPGLAAWFEPTIPIDPIEPFYDAYITIEDNQILDAAGYLGWDFHQNPPLDSIWGALDPNGQEFISIPPQPDSTDLTGTYAQPKRQNMPDIAQQTNECGPTSTANSFRWLAKKYGFEAKLPTADDDLIKDLMKAMTGSNTRPFPGLTGNQLYDGKKKYIKDKGLPLVVKGGNTDPNASGAKAYDFICSELKAGEDVEFLIAWPGGGAHWVTAIGCGVNGDRLFIEVMDPDDGKTGAVEWELQRNGNFVTPKGTMLWAVSESPVPDPFETPPSTPSEPTSIEFGAGPMPPIPPDFFGPGSDPFVGVIEFEGEPIDLQLFGSSDTLVERLEIPIDPLIPAPASNTVDIELIELSLVSTMPITVTFGGVPETWDVRLELSDTAPAVPGSLTATKTHGNGGTFDATIPVQPLFVFTRESDQLQVELDTGLLAIPAINVAVSGAPWVHNLDSSISGYYPFDGAFIAGVDQPVPGDTSSQVVLPTTFVDSSNTVFHTVIPPIIPPLGDEFLIPALPFLWGVIAFVTLGWVARRAFALGKQGRRR